MSESICSSAGRPAKPSLSRVFDRDWLTLAVTWPSSISAWLTSTGLAGSSGKTSPVSCRRAEDGTLVPSSGRWANSGTGGPTECLTLSTSEYPQRRRRVFVVGYLGDWRRAAAVLFESASLRWDPPPSREAGQDVAGALGASTGGSDADDGEQRRLVAGSLTRGASNGGGWRIGADEAAQGHIVADSLRCRRPGEGGIAGDDTHLVAPQVSPALNTQSGGHHAPDTKAYVVQTAQTITRSWHRSNGASAGSNHGLINPVHHAQGVRRLTPRECERLQGFPDDWTLVPHNGKPAADGPRYEAIGNSMAVPVMRWLGQRIQLVEDL